MKPVLLLPYVVIACSAVFFWSLSARTIVWTSMPMIAAELELTGSMAGTIISAHLLGITAATWSSGWMPGSLKQRILGSVLLSIPLIGLVSVARDFQSMIATCLFLGLAIGLYRPLGLSLIVEAGGANRQALYMAVHETSASLACFIGAAWVAATLASFSWRGALLAWCSVGIAAFLAFLRVEDGRRGAEKEGPRESPPLDSRVAYCAVALFAGNLMVSGLIAVLPLIMVRAWGIDAAFAAWVVGSSKLVNLLGVSLVGARADRWGHIRTARWLMALGLVGLAGMSSGGYGPLFLAGFAGMAVAAGGTMTILPAVVAEAYLPQQKERALSNAMGASSLFGSVLCPPVFGALLDVGLPTAPMIVAAILCLLAFLSLGRMAAHQAIQVRA